MNYSNIKYNADHLKSFHFNISFNNITEHDNIRSQKCTSYFLRPSEPQLLLNFDFKPKMWCMALSWGLMKWSVTFNWWVMKNITLADSTFTLTSTETQGSWDCTISLIMVLEYGPPQSRTVIECSTAPICTSYIPLSRQGSMLNCWNSYIMSFHELYQWWGRTGPLNEIHASE